MPSAHSILENEGMNPSYGACSNVMADTHKNTLTYGMNNRMRKYDMALDESMSYANGAEGIATYAHPDGYVGKVWSNIEKPILGESDIIIQGRNYRCKIVKLMMV